MSADELIDAIDSQNRVIGQITRDESYKNKISHRVVHVMVCWEDQIFIPRRSLKARYLPGYYCSSSGGHVRSGESSEQGALRELKEEIGLDGPIELVKQFFYTHEFLVHTSLFIKRFDPETEHIALNDEEVMSGAFYTLKEIEKLDADQFHPQLIPCLVEIKNFLGATKD